MKLKSIKIGKLLIMGVAIFTFSCSDDVLKESENTQETALIKREPLKSEKWQAKEDFAVALSSAVNESFELRKLIRTEALKMFNKDYDLLVYSVKDAILEDNLTFEELINSHLREGKSLQGILNVEPTLTVFVPELPLDSFSAEKWDIASEIPAVAIRTNVIEDVPFITPEGTFELMSYYETPGFPIVVVKNNERLVSNIESSDFDNYDTRIVYNQNGVAIKFWANSFDNELKRDKNFAKRKTNNLDPVITQAYNIYQQQYPNLDGWQRDYIYYGIKPSSPNGHFVYDFKETIRSFGLRAVDDEGNETADAKETYGHISNSTEDPKYRNNHRINTISNWTDGNFEFKMRLITNSKNGLGGEHIDGFSLKPDKLFSLEYTIYKKGVWPNKRRYFRFKNISFNPPVDIDMELINWDLESYSSSIKIEMEEVDLAVTTVTTDSRVVDFATNFEINANVSKKMGLKFGANFKSTQTRTVQKTYTEGNDQLGFVIVNFSDNVITKKEAPNKWVTREYKTGYCKFSVEPKRVQ